MTEDVPTLEAAIVRLAAICSALPESYQEPAWIGTRWAVRKRTFAHVARVADGRPPLYARTLAAAGILSGTDGADGPDGADGTALVLTFESDGAELAALRNSDAPFFAPPWRPTIVGLCLDGTVGWDEIAELLTESYLVRAPAGLARLVDPGR